MISKVIKFLELDCDNKYVSYVYILLLIFSSSLFVLNLNDIFHIHVYRQDALYYIQANDYFDSKVSTEGRWINYFLFDLVSNIDGKILSLFVLSSFGYFMFFVSYKWTKNIYYSIMLTMLFMQITPLYSLLQWPAVITPAFIVLLFSIYFYKKIKNIFLFFGLMGILFFGTMSNYYYLVPFLFLEYFLRHDWKQNLRFTFYRLLPAWALGFIVGYIIAQLFVYINFHHFIKIAEWRSPNYIHSFDDLEYNFLLSFKSLSNHLKSVIVNFGFGVLAFFAIIISTLKRRKDLIFIPLLIFVFIAIIHYIVILPVGIYISPRTVIPTWISVFAILFFVPNVKKWQIYILIPVIVLYSYNMYVSSNGNLKWYATVTNKYFDEFIDLIGEDALKYKRLAVYANNSDIAQKTRKISSDYTLQKDQSMEGLGSIIGWIAIANEVKFEYIDICYKDKITTNDICKKASVVCNKNQFIKSNDLYDVCGELDKYIIIKFND